MSSTKKPKETKQEKAYRLYIEAGGERNKLFQSGQRTRVVANRQGRKTVKKKR